MSSCAGIVIAKTIYGRVPKRLIAPDQLGFNRYNEIGICSTQQHESAPEIFNV